MAIGANLGFEAQFLLAADKLRESIAVSDYEHVPLRLIFLRYISEAFEANHAALLGEVRKAQVVAFPPNSMLPVARTPS